MMKPIAAIAVVLISVASAAPVADELFSIAGRSTITTAKVNFSLGRTLSKLTDAVQFDDLPAGLVPLLSPAIPVPYQGLNFTNFGVSNPGIGGVDQGVRPQSEPNLLGNGARRRATGGLPSFNIVNTMTDSFRLDHFSFGCLETPAARQARVAVGCTISVTGVKKGGATVGPKFFTFASTDPINATMALATFEKNSWTELTKATLDVTAMDG